jgi:hypothetical protein
MAEANLHILSEIDNRADVARRATADISEWMSDGDGFWGEDDLWSAGVPCGKQTAVLPPAISVAYTVTIADGGKLHPIGGLELFPGSSIEIPATAPLVISTEPETDECHDHAGPAPPGTANEPPTDAPNKGNGQSANYSDRDSSDKIKVTAENTKELHSKSPDNATEVPGSKQEPALRIGLIVGGVCALFIGPIVLVAVMKWRKRSRKSDRTRRKPSRRNTYANPMYDVPDAVNFSRA